MGKLATKVNVLRALSAVIARLALKFFAIVASAVFTLCFMGICLLVYFFGSWWWLLLVVYIPLLIMVIAIYVVTRLIVWRIYPHRLTREQTEHLREFSDKIIRLLETRGLGWWWLTTVCIKDLLLHHELHTLKSLLADTTSLKGDFTHLEQELKR